VPGSGLPSWARCAPCCTRRPRAARHRYGRDLRSPTSRCPSPSCWPASSSPLSPSLGRGRVGVVVLLSITATLTRLRTPTELTPPATQHRPKGTRRP
jgi:hypothetical protein